MRDYFLDIINRTGQTRTYLLLAEIPTVSGSQARVLQVVIASKTVPSRGRASLHIELDMLAYCGSTESFLNPYVDINVAQALPVNGAQICLKMEDGAPTFDSSPASDSKASFTLTTGSDLSKNEIDDSKHKHFAR